MRNFLDTTGDFGQSEDVAQESFVVAWRKLDTLRDRTKFKSWICGIARHLALGVVKRRRPEETLDSARHGNDEVQSPGEQAASREEAALVWNALEGLPETYREPLILFYREEQSVAKVAEGLDLTESAVKQRLSRGREMLRDRVRSLVETTLAGTKPGTAFTLAVMGALPGIVTGTAAAASAGVAGKTAMGTAAAGVGSGALLGTLGGVLGGGIGVFMGLQTARYERQKRLIRRGAAWIFGGVVAFLAAGLIAQFAWLDSPGVNPPWPTVFWGIWMIAFFAFIAISSFWLGLAARRITREAERSGEREVPATAVRNWLQRWEGRDWSSKAHFLGLPLVRIAFGNPDRDFTGENTGGSNRSRMKTARGWIALGDRAVGLVALGNIAMGGIAIGSVSVGIVAFGGVATGGIAFGGLALGILAIAGIALGWGAIGGYAAGWNAFGGAAFGWKAAVGGLACAREYALGGSAHAAHANDEAAKAFVSGNWFFDVAEWYLGFVQSGVFVPAFWIVALAFTGIILGLGIRRKSAPAERSGTQL